MTQAERLFAVIPAAGLSRRMGRPKLLLPLGSKTVIRRLLDVLRHDQITDRVIVVRESDAHLQAEAEAAGATVIQPASDPPDMRSSVEYALKNIQERHNPAPAEGWMLIPADHPVLDGAVIDRLIQRWFSERDLILVPKCGDRRGHPTFFRWSLAAEVPRLPAHKGINALLEQHQNEVTEVSEQNQAVTTDLDTEEEYQALLRQFSARDE